jgi:pyruvate dehydrogenase E1 component alpha subunit
MEVTREKAHWMFETMMRIRRFEEKAADLVATGKLFGEVHVYIGEEASGVGVCAALRQDDKITSTHRGHGHIIAKGGDVKLMMAELFGRRTGYCKGKGGSMHVADVKLGILGANGIVGGGISIATGSGFASQFLGQDAVTVCFFGDGASNQGSFHESLNLATCWKLPVVYVCENNKYHEFSPSEPLIASTIHGRARAYDIPGVHVDGQDVLAVYDVAQEAVNRARAGEGPTLIEVDTYRFSTHFEGEVHKFETDYRPEAEKEAWFKRDPITLFRTWLVDNEYATEAELDKIDQAVQGEIEAALEFALASPWPEPEEALEDLFV